MDPGSGLLCLNYIGASVLACLMPHAFNPIIMIGGHGILTGKLILETVHIDQENYKLDAIQRYASQFLRGGKRSAVLRYYGWIWILFYLEYCLFPFL